MDTIELLKRLINCRSITPQQAGALDLAQEILTAAGFTCRRLPAGEVDNLWAVDNCPPKLIFAGHVDVVPPGELDAWDTAPFTAAERDGFIYGRGATDMKSAVAAMLNAACQLRRDNIGGVAVLLTSDEEGEAICGTRHVVEWWHKNGGDKIDYAIVGEPTCSEYFGDAIKIGRRGSLTARVTIDGKQAHVAYPQRGDNPAHRLAVAMGELLQRVAWLPSPEGVVADSAAVDFPPTGVQVVKITSDGGADNIIPAQATATVNFRYAPADNADDLRRLTEDCLRRAADDKWRCDWTHGAQPFITRADGDLITALQQSIFDVSGRRAALSTGGGTSDGRFLRTMCRQLAEFGVINDTMHAVNECVEISAVHHLAAVYEQTARRLLK